MCQLIEERFIFGPGSLKGQPARIDPLGRAFIYAAYEVYPKWHEWRGRRRYKRACLEVRKGLAKTEKGAWITGAELHPEGPVRCDGFDASGNPVGRPVVDPYIPMLAVTAEQVEELAYGALYVMLTEGPDADLFDCSLERIIRLSERGRTDGKAVPLSNNPGARDGARTSFQMFDEPHRLVLPRQVQAHETMVANLEKRVLEDPWGLYVGTAGEPGQGSVAEGLFEEAKAIEAGEVEDPELFFYHRDCGEVNPQTGQEWDLTSFEERKEAIRIASLPLGEFGPGQFHSIAKQWDRKGADKQYLERVWLNRWVKSSAQAFDLIQRGKLVEKGALIERGAFVTVGFDGARFRDSTAFVLTEIETGLQQVHSVWEKPLDLPEGQTWEVPEEEVTEAMTEIQWDYDVWRANCDPPYWTSTVAEWAGEHENVEEWWTNRTKPMAWAIKEYREAMDAAEVGYAGGHPLEEEFQKHAAAAGRTLVNFWDDDGQQLFILSKLHPDRKFDIQMAAVLSWQARLAAIAAGAEPSRYRRSSKVGRLR